jgi:hypothetical protein
VQLRFNSSGIFIILIVKVKEMELKVNIDYNQILKLIYQLPENEIEKLVNTLQTNVLTKKAKKSIQMLLLEGSTWTESELEEYQNARNYINKSRIA